MLSIGPYSYDDVAAAVQGLRAAARQRGDEDPNVYRALGEALALKGRAEEAIEAYRAAMKPGGSVSDCIRLGELSMRRRRPQEALPYLAKAAETANLEPALRHSLSRAFDELSDAFFAAGDFSMALECHEVAWRLEPGSIDSAVAAALKHHENNVLKDAAPGLVPVVDGGPTFYVALAVWGEAYTRYFLNACLPSLLAPGNLPYLAKRERVLFTVYSTQASIAMLDADDTFALLRRHADVLFIEIPQMLIDQTRRGDVPPSVRYRSTLQLVTAQHHITTIMAAACGAGVFYLVPDWVLSDGCLRTLHLGIERGDEVFAAPILLANRAGLTRSLAPYAEPAGVLSVPAGDLARHGAANLHDSWRQFIPDGERFTARQFPSWMLWPVGDDGFVLHAFHWSVLCVSAERLAKYQGQRFWTLDHRLLDALLENDEDWNSVTLCADTKLLTILAAEDEGKAYAWASTEPRLWGLAEIVTEASPGTSLLSLSQVNHLLFREPVLFGGGMKPAAQAAAIARAAAMVDAIGDNTVEVSIKRV